PVAVTLYPSSCSTLRQPSRSVRSSSTSSSLRLAFTSGAIASGSRPIAGVSTDGGADTSLMGKSEEKAEDDMGLLSEGLLTFGVINYNKVLHLSIIFRCN